MITVRDLIAELGTDQETFYSFDATIAYAFPEGLDARISDESADAIREAWNADADPVINAVAALKAWGDDLSYEDAENLLAMWSGRRTLTAAQLVEVLAFFPCRPAAPDYHAPHELEARRIAAEARAELRNQRYSYDATEQRAKNAERLITAACDLSAANSVSSVASIAALKETVALSDVDFIEALGAHLDAGHLIPFGGFGYSVEWRGKPITAVRPNL